MNSYATLKRIIIASVYCGLVLYTGTGLQAANKKLCEATPAFGGPGCSIFEGDCGANETPHCSAGVFSSTCKCKPIGIVWGGFDTDVPSVSSSRLYGATLLSNYMASIGTTTANAVASDISTIVTAVSLNNRVTYNVGETNFVLHYAALPQTEKDAMAGWLATYGPSYPKESTDGSQNTTLALRLNTATSPVQISFYVPEAGNASIEVFDITGRRVATIFSGSASAGQNEVYWNVGNKETGNVPHGLYFVRLTTGMSTLIEKININ